MKRLWTTLVIGVVCLTALGPVGTASAQRKSKKTAATTKADPPAAPLAPPDIVVAGIRVTGPGYGDNRTELRPFNEEPGVALALAIKMPAGVSLIKLDEDACKLTAVADDTGQDLLENGRYGPFPKMTADGSAGMIEIESKLRPAAGAQFITAEGTLVFLASSGAKAQKIAKIKLEKGFAMKVGAGTVAVGDLTAGEGSQTIQFTATKAILDSIKDIRFLDASGNALDAYRSERGSIGDEAEAVYSIKSATKPVAFEFLVWQAPTPQSVPYKIKANLGLR